MTTVNRPSRPHRAYRGFTDEWLTPPEIIRALGDFDLDPCCPKDPPWQTAAELYHAAGLSSRWFGRVWLNPPYGPLAAQFMARMAAHGRGTALVFARTETEWFHATVWDAATAVMFFRGRLHFHDATGARAKGNAGGPSVLVAYGEADALALEAANFTGRFIRLAPAPTTPGGNQ